MRTAGTGEGQVCGRRLVQEGARLPGGRPAEAEAATSRPPRVKKLPRACRVLRHVGGEKPEEVGAQGSPVRAGEAERGREEPRGPGRWRRGLGGSPDRREPAVAGDVPGPGLVSGREAARALCPASRGRPVLLGASPGSASR